MDEAEPHRTAVSFEVRDELGQSLTNALGEFVCETESSDWSPGAAGAIAWTLPAHASYRAAFGAEGFTTVYVEGNVPLHPEDRAMPIVLTRRAQLHVGGGAQLVEGFPGNLEPAEDGFVIDAAAGPLTIVVAREGGPPLALDLVLAPGESRRIEVK